MKRKIKFTLYSTIMMIGIILSLLLLNLLFEKLDSKFNLSLDMTSNRLYSLTSTTMDLLDGLESDIYIYTTETAGIEDSNVNELLKNYTAVSDKVHVLNIDIVKDPSVIKHYNEYVGNEVSAGNIIISNSYDTNDGTQRYMILDYGQFYIYDEETETYDGFAAENAITNAIRYISYPNDKKIWILDNHIADYQSIEYIKNILFYENYQVEMLNLLNGQSVLHSDDTVIILSLASDITAIERDILNDFLDGGGKILLGIDITMSEEDDFSSAISLAEKYNVKFGEGTVKETDLENIAVTDDSNYMYSFILAKMTEHEITNDFILGDYNILLGMNVGRLVLPNKINNADIDISPLLYTSDTSYIEHLNPQTNDEHNQLKEHGEFPVLLVVEDEEKGSKMMITSSPEIFTYTQILRQNAYKNKDFFLESIRYLSDRNDEYKISSKPMKDAPLMISTMKQAYFIIVFVCIVLPLTIFGAGLFVYLKRKNL